MRVAVLTLIERTGGEAGDLRGALPIGGRSILRHQLGLALALGCTRIVVMAEAISGDLVALQHVAEATGAQFHVIATARGLVPLLPPEDDVIVLSDGLLAMPDNALELLGQGPVVLTLPVETALAAGYERIDINHAGAGAMRFAGRVAAGLADLPPEWNAASALLRLAVQHRVPLRGVPGALLDEGRWNLIRSEPEAHAAEIRWLKLHTTTTESRSPGEALAALVVHRFGPALLHAGTRPPIVALAAGVLGLLGGGAGWLGSSAIGFVLLGLAWVVQQMSSLLARVERDSLLASGIARHSFTLFQFLIDAGFVTLAAWRSGIPATPGVPWGIGAYAPLVLFGLLRLVPMVMNGRVWPRWLKDRLLAGGLLAFVSVFLPFDASLGIMALALLAAALIAAGLDAEKRRDRPNLALTNRG